MDQCTYCVLRGNYDECKVTDCSQHESWFGIETAKRLKDLEQQLQTAIENEQVVLDCLNGSSSHKHMDKYRKIDIADYDRRKEQLEKAEAKILSMERDIAKLENELEKSANKIVIKDTYKLTDAGTGTDVEVGTFEDVAAWSLGASLTGKTK